MNGNPNKKLIERINELTGDKPYGDPQSFSSDSIVAIRIRSARTMDRTTGLFWCISDKLFILEAEKDSLGARRTVSLTRGEGEEQVIFNLDIDEDTLTLAGLGMDLFHGDAREEFLAGLRIIQSSSS